jgi:hypothetical protein
MPVGAPPLPSVKLDQNHRRRGGWRLHVAGAAPVVSWGFGTVETERQRGCLRIRQVLARQPSVRESELRKVPAWGTPARAGRGGLRPGRAGWRSVGHELRQGPIWRPPARACGGRSSTSSARPQRGNLRPGRQCASIECRRPRPLSHVSGDTPARNSRATGTPARNHALAAPLRRPASCSRPRATAASGLADEQKSGSSASRNWGRRLPPPQMQRPCASFPHFLVRFAGGLTCGDEVVASHGGRQEEVLDSTPRRPPASVASPGCFFPLFF